MGRYSSSYEITRTLKTQDEAKHAIIPLYTARDGSIYGTDSATPSLIIGRPRTGKTANLLIPFVENMIEKEESGIVADSKGIVCSKTIKKAQEKGYNIYVFDFANPQNSDGCDPIFLLGLEYKAGGYLKERSLCSLNSIAQSVVPKDKDEFWTLAPIELIEAVARYLFEFFEPSEINATALRDILSAGEERFAGSLGFGEIKAALDEKLDVSNPMSGIANCATETRNCLLSIAKNALSHFTKTEGIRAILERNNVDVFNLDTEAKSIFYFVLPEETKAYNVLAAILIDCIIKRYYQANRETGQPLKRRCNIVIDELGNLAEALPAFDTYCTTSRSRNIRICACVQSLTQLRQAFSEHKAEIIEDSLNNIIAFSSSNIDTLHRLSERSGTYTNPISGKIAPTISPSNIGKLKAGQSLVFSGSLCFTNRYAYDESKSTEVPIIVPRANVAAPLKKRTDVTKLIWQKKKEELEKMISEKVAREIEQTTFKHKKKSIFLPIFRRVFKKKKRTPFDSLPF